MMVKILNVIIRYTAFIFYSSVSLSAVLLKLIVEFVILVLIFRLVNIAAMNDEIVIGNRILCSSDYRAIEFEISIDR